MEENKTPKVEGKKQAEWPEWENIVLHHDKAVPFEIEKFDEGEMDLNEFIKKIPGQTKENPYILNANVWKNDPIEYEALKKLIGETIYVGDEFCCIKWIKIVEE